MEFFYKFRSKTTRKIHSTLIEITCATSKMVIHRTEYAVITFIFSGKSFGSNLSEFMTKRRDIVTKTIFSSKTMKRSRTIKKAKRTMKRRQWPFRRRLTRDELGYFQAPNGCCIKICVPFV